MSLLGTLVGFVLPSPVDAIARRIRPNPYAPKVGRAHWEAALAQAAAPGAVVGIRGGLAGGSGSEAADNGFDPHAYGRPSLEQDVSAHALPPAMFTANVGRSPSIRAFDRGPINLAHHWGVQQRGMPRVLASTLLRPGDRTPTPREMARGYSSSRAGHHLRLDDMFAEEPDR